MSVSKYVAFRTIIITFKQNNSNGHEQVGRVPRKHYLLKHCNSKPCLSIVGESKYTAQLTQYKRFHMSEANVTGMGHQPYVRKNSL